MKRNLYREMMMKMPYEELYRRVMGVYEQQQRRKKLTEEHEKLQVIKALGKTTDPIERWKLFDKLAELIWATESWRLK